MSEQKIKEGWAVDREMRIIYHWTSSETSAKLRILDPAMKGKSPVIRTDGDFTTINGSGGTIKDFLLQHIGGYYRDKGIPDYNERAKRILKESETSQVTIDDVIENVTLIANYGPVDGMDILYKGRKFRLKGDDFLSAKGFKIWLLSEFGENLRVQMGANNSQWTYFVSVLQKLSEIRPSAQDDLAPPVFQDLTGGIMRNKVYHEWEEEALIDLDKSGIKSYFLIDGVFYLHSKIYNDIMEHHELTRRKMRQYFEPYLIEQNSVVVHQHDLFLRFWKLDWKRLSADFPELSSLNGGEGKHVVVYISGLEQPTEIEVGGSKVMLRNEDIITLPESIAKQLVVDGKGKVVGK